LFCSGVVAHLLWLTIAGQEIDFQTFISAIVFFLRSLIFSLTSARWQSGA